MILSIFFKKGIRNQPTASFASFLRYRSMHVDPKSTIHLGIKIKKNKERSEIRREELDTWHRPGNWTE